MELVIRPFEGMGPIDFNMSRDTIVATLGQPSDEISPIKWRYRDSDLFVSFDDAGLCDYVEADYAKNTFVVRGLRLSGDYDQVVKLLKAAGYSLVPGNEQTADDQTTYCPDLGILLWRLDETGDPLTLIGAWRRGLWDPYPFGPKSNMQQ
ncbi:MAG: hypothetical protein ACRDIU_02250 [Actinomycetota bacterium]